MTILAGKKMEKSATYNAMSKQMDISYAGDIAAAEMRGKVQALPQIMQELRALNIFTEEELKAAALGMLAGQASAPARPLLGNFTSNVQQKKLGQGPNESAPPRQ